LSAEPKKNRIAIPIAALMAAMVCFQLGSVMAKGLFPVLGASGVASLRLALASAMLVAVWRPWRMRFNWREARTILVYGLAMGWMNFFFYLSLRDIPLGIAVALEFSGPLVVAVLSSRRVSDFLWILMAALGLAALLPIGLGAKPLPASGVAYALAAGACWALYIVFGRKAGAAHGGPTTALGMLIGAIVIVPIGLVHSGTQLFSLAILPTAIGIALLSSALPYSLEMFALPRVPASTFGVLMSLDPAFGALSGLWFLGESLTLMQWAAIASIMVASAGSASMSNLMPD
jgi:inner membrane transporter RhtA